MVFASGAVVFGMASNQAVALETKADGAIEAPFYVKGDADEWADHQLSEEVDTYYFTGASNAISAYAYTYEGLSGNRKFHIYDKNKNVLSPYFKYEGACVPSSTWTYENDMGFNDADGSYTFFIAEDLNNFGGKGYGVSILRKMGKTVLKITFDNAVPEWANLYIPGTFNNWSLRDSLMVPNAARTEFTYTLNSTYEFNQKYKIVSDYAENFDGESGNPVWTHEITSKDQTKQFQYNPAATDESPVSYTLHENLHFDMTRDPLPEGAYMSIKFTSSVPEGVKFYLGSNMFGWANQKANAEFVAHDVDRTEFRMDLSSLANVYAAAYTCQVVAMSAHNTSESISYDYTVIDSQEVTLSSSDAENEIGNNLSYSYLDEVVAHDFADRFVSEVGGVCDPDGKTNQTNLETAWAKYNTEYSGKSTARQNILKNANGNTRYNNGSFADFDALYCYAYEAHAAHWTLNNFLGWTLTPKEVSISPISVATKESSAAIVVASIGIAAVIGAGALFLLRKKKEQ